MLLKDERFQALWVDADSEAHELEAIYRVTSRLFKLMIGLFMGFLSVALGSVLIAIILPLAGLGVAMVAMLLLVPSYYAYRRHGIMTAAVQLRLKEHSLKGHAAYVHRTPTFKALAAAVFLRNNTDLELLLRANNPRIEQIVRSYAAHIVDRQLTTSPEDWEVIACEARGAANQLAELATTPE